jgi:signal transduction histidine kinase/ligand-binding sensor domain-containing protein
MRGYRIVVFLLAHLPFLWAAPPTTTPSTATSTRKIARATIVNRSDVRFRKLSNPQNLSQVRVHSIVQDDQGFLWFATWNGLNRYDGYKFKVFKHEAGDDSTLSGTHIFALFRDRDGGLWVGTDRFLDRFNPQTETFQHYRLDEDKAGPVPDQTVVNHITQDSRGMLWLSTRKGLVRLDPKTGRQQRYLHDPQDPNSLGDTDIKTSGEDRSGAFWVATSQSLDEFDRDTGKVKRHIATGESGVGLWFHEDRTGTFWLIYGSDGRIATLDRAKGSITDFQYDLPIGNPGPGQSYAMLEDQDGAMWFGTTAAGLLRFERNGVSSGAGAGSGGRFVSYRHNDADKDSIGENRVISLFEDRESNIWVGLHQAEPNFFRKKPLPFENLTRNFACGGESISGLVTSIFQDSRGYLWISANLRFHRLDRRTGECTTMRETNGSEVLAVTEDSRGVMWLSNAAPGLLRYDLKAGQRTGYKHDSANPKTLCSGIVDQGLVDRAGTFWMATWDGLCKFDERTQQFTRYKPDPGARGLNYYTIAEGPDGAIWTGGNLGLHRFDPGTSTFQTWSHNFDDLAGLSDNRVNAVFFDHTGRLWVGTQNGLDLMDREKGTFTKYDQRSGIAGNAVSCILEDRRGTLWMSTNKGITSFRPDSAQFANYTVADGLPGPDLTGWGSCYQSAAGEMFFAGFSGATSFFPQNVEQDRFAEPKTALTDFRLFGASVKPGTPSSPLQSAINRTSSVRLSHQQNIFSIEFSALTFLNPGTARYRYRMEGLESAWHEVGSDERLASYTTLSAGNYTFHVQSATSRGEWSKDLALAIEVLPPFWQAEWFVLLCAAATAAAIWMMYQARLTRLREEFNLRLEERVGERTRIAQELHDTLLQNLTGLSLQISGLAKKVSGSDPIKESLADLRRQAEDCLREARQSVWEIRSPESDSIDLPAEIAASGTLFTAGRPVTFSFRVEGQQVPMPADTRQQLLRIAREAISNSVQHAGASRIEATLFFRRNVVTLRVSDDGKGFDVGEAQRLSGHFGLATMRERAARISATLNVISNGKQGTMIEVTVPIPATIEAVR